MMTNIERLIETLYDEEGTMAKVVVGIAADWTWFAKILDGSFLMLCAAGETFLLTDKHASAEKAIAALDAIVAKGYARAEEIKC
jgi:hypothetical protein